MNRENSPATDFNPFFVYVGGFLLVIVLYQLDWSYLYPNLTWALLTFFALTFLISIAIGIYIHHKRVILYHGNIRLLNFKWILIAITIGNILDFVYEGQVPLFSILNKITQDNYGYFGIPTFNVVISTLGSFMAVYLFNCYLVTKKKKYLLGCLYLIVFPLLLFSRGAILLILSSMLFLYLFSISRNKAKVYFKLILLLVIVLLGFGYLGNIRVSNQIDKDNKVDNIILKLGEAKPAFVNSAIPSQFFWSYIYVTSPLANLQYAINTTEPSNNFEGSIRYVNYELTYDALSKRIGGIIGVDRRDNNLMVPYLTVSTLYASSYTDLGWVGMTFTFFVLMGICLIYLLVLKSSSPYFATGVAILNTLVLFCIFDNMISFTGLSFQLIYPILLSLKWKKTKPLSIA